MGKDRNAGARRGVGDHTGALPSVWDLEPPPCDTGVNRTVGLGWVRGTLRTGDPGGVAAVLARHLGSTGEEGHGWGRWYAQSMRWDHAAVAWEPVAGSNAADECLVEVAQKGLDGLGAAGSLALLGELVAVGLRVSRLDTWLDDAERVASPAVVRAAEKAGQYVGRVQPGGWFEDDSTGGSTAYLGARESERMLRTYDADAVHGHGGVRWEEEQKGARADQAARVLLAAGPDGMGAAVVGMLVDLVDFRDRERAAAHGERAARLSWWARLVGSVAGIRLALPARVDTLGRRIAWLRKQAAPSLALLFWRDGSAGLRRLAVEGERRLSPAQWALARAPGSEGAWRGA